MASLQAVSDLAVASTNCTQLYPAGTTYQGFTIECGVDYFGNDIKHISASTFEDCITACSTTDSCNDVSFVQDQFTCYLKFAAGNYRTDSNVWTAKRAPAQSTTPSLTCVDDSANGTVYDGFTILCGVDYFGGDLKNSQTATFAECIDLCNSTSSCVDVSYTGTMCYLKSTIGPLSTNANVWTATKQGAVSSTTQGLTCVDNKADGTTYTTSKGTYNIFCNKDYHGGDLTNKQTSSFESCIALCDATTDCIDVTYHGRTCYMKSYLTTLRTSNDDWTAVLASAISTNSTTTPTDSSVTCVDNKDNGTIYTAQSGGQYEIECGIDYVGGDMAGYNVASFAECIEKCDATSPCIDVAYNAPVCYLKKSLTAGVQHSYVWGAKYVGVASTSSSTTTTTTTTTPIPTTTTTTTTTTTDDTTTTTTTTTPIPTTTTSITTTITTTTDDPISTTTTSQLTSQTLPPASTTTSTTTTPEPTTTTTTTTTTPLTTTPEATTTATTPDTTTPESTTTTTTSPDPTTTTTTTTDPTTTTTTTTPDTTTPEPTTTTTTTTTTPTLTTTTTSSDPTTTTTPATITTATTTPDTPTTTSTTFTTITTTPEITTTPTTTTQTMTTTTTTHTVVPPSQSVHIAIVRISDGHIMNYLKAPPGNSARAVAYYASDLWQRSMPYLLRSYSAYFGYSPQSEDEAYGYLSTYYDLVEYDLWSEDTTTGILTLDKVAGLCLGDYGAIYVYKTTKPTSFNCEPVFLAVEYEYVDPSGLPPPDPGNTCSDGGCD